MKKILVYINNYVDKNLNPIYKNAFIFIACLLLLIIINGSPLLLITKIIIDIFIVFLYFFLKSKHPKLLNTILNVFIFNFFIAIISWSIIKVDSFLYLLLGGGIISIVLSYAIHYLKKKVSVK